MLLFDGGLQLPGRPLQHLRPRLLARFNFVTEPLVRSQSKRLRCLRGGESAYIGASRCAIADFICQASPASEMSPPPCRRFERDTPFGGRASKVSCKRSQLSIIQSYRNAIVRTTILGGIRRKYLKGENRAIVALGSPPAKKRPIDCVPGHRSPFPSILNAPANLLLVF